MKHVSLGGLEVSCLGLGAMGMSAFYTGAGIDDAESIRTIRRALELVSPLSTRQKSTVPIQTNSSLGGQSSAAAMKSSSLPSSG